MDERAGITQLLNRWTSGDAAALDELAPVLYDELRRLAARHMASQPGRHTLQPTALVNEAYLKLAGREGLEFRSRASFFALLATAMRQVLVDHARARNAQKRGGEDDPIHLTDGLAITPVRPAEIEALDEALKALEKVDARKARAIELKYFAGMTGQEIGEALGVGTATVTRDLRMAEAWLRHQMTGG